MEAWVLEPRNVRPRWREIVLGDYIPIIHRNRGWDRRELTTYEERIIATLDIIGDVDKDTRWEPGKGNVATNYLMDRQGINIAHRYTRFFTTAGGSSREWTVYYLLGRSKDWRQRYNHVKPHSKGWEPINPYVPNKPS